VSFSGYGKLFNDGGELVAEGRCDVDPERGTVNLHPAYDNPYIERQEGLLRLEMEDGAELSLASRVIRFRLNVPGAPQGLSYRLFFSNQRLREGRAEGGHS
jgi:hypothetical protein